MKKKYDVLVSIVIPSYNHEKYIRRAIDSVLEQKIVDFELIIIDDASTDKTTEIVAGYLSDKRIKLIVNPKNLGSFGNNSKAIKYGRGKYFVWLHGDDFMLPGHLSAAINALEEHQQCVLAYSPCYWVDENDNIIKLLEHPGHKEEDYFGGRNEIADLLSFDNYITPSSVVFRKTSLDQFPGFDLSIRAGDWYLFSYLALKFSDFIFLKKASTAYRIHDNQYSKVEFYNSARPLEAHIGILEKALSYGDLKWIDGRRVQIKNYLLNRVSSYPEEIVAKYKEKINQIITILDSSPTSKIITSEQIIKSKLFEENSLVSVIVPTMNRPGLLKRALRSLVNQNHKNWEAIVVNDAGEDTRELVMSIDPLSRIQYVSHSENKGLSAARNTGIKNSKGSVICYLDDDDVFLPQHIATVVAALEENQTEFVYCEAIYVSEKEQNGVLQEVSRNTPLSGILFSKDRLNVSNFIPVNAWGHRRGLLEKSGLFDSSLPALEDWDMLLRFSRFTDFIHIPKLTVEVHQRHSSGGDHMLDRERNKFPELYRQLYDRYPVDSYKVQKKRMELLASWGIDYKPANFDTSILEVSKIDSSIEKVLISYDFLGGSVVNIAREMVKNNPKDYVNNEKKHDLYVNIANEILFNFQEKKEEQKSLRQAVQLLGEVLEEDPGLEKALKLRAKILELLQTSDYHNWIKNHQIREIDGELFAERMVLKWHQRPIFHFIMFLFPGEESFLADTLDSFAAQLYQGWRLTVIAETKAPDLLWQELDVLKWIQFSGEDPYKLVNDSIFDIQADWVSFIEPGMRMLPHTLIRVGDYINSTPYWNFIYTDEDLVDVQGNRIDPKFKPDFNLDMLRSTPFIGRACLVKQSFLESIGGYQAYSGFENTDVAFKAFEQSGEKSIGHISDVLFSFNKTIIREKNELDFQKSIQHHLQRSNIVAVVHSGYIALTTQVIYLHEEIPKVSIIILNCDCYEYLESCLRSLIDKTEYPDYEIVIVDYGTTDKDTLYLYDEMTSLLQDKFRVIEYQGDLNFSAMSNKGVNSALSDYILFLNNDTEVLHKEWLSRMMSHVQRDDVGVVGARLSFPETGKIQHAGIILGLKGNADASFYKDLTLKESGYMNRGQIVQNYSAVTDRCMLVKREVYHAVSGMDEQQFFIANNDVDLCLKIRKTGYRIVWTPFSTLISYNLSREKMGKDDFLAQAKAIDRAQQDRSNLLSKWLPIMADDPVYNPNLSLAHSDFRIEVQIPRNWDVNFHDRDRVLGFPLSGGSGDYRIIQPFDALSNEGRQQCEYYRIGNSSDKIMVSLLEIARLKPDTLVIQAAINDFQIHLLEEVNEFLPDIYRIFTIDDLITNVPVKSSAYKDNQRNFKDVKKRLRKVLSICHRLIVSTEPLADVFKDMIEDIQVIPNRLVRNKWCNLKSLRQAGDKPRVGWAGAQQHQGDLEIIFDTVKETADEVDWIFMGMCPDEIRPFVKEFHDFVAIDAYPEKMASLNLDLAIAPLEINPFNEAKSNLRLLEYGILGWPVVCTDIYPYQSYNAPVTRVRNSTDAWINAIRMHVHNMEMTAKSGDQLRSWVMDNFILEDNLNDWQNALSPQQNQSNNKPKKNKEIDNSILRSH